MNPEIPANQRAWLRQRSNPTPCRYGCGVNLVFMKNEVGHTIACDAKKIIVDAPGISIVTESGEIQKEKRRFGWPVHDCLVKRQQDKAIHEVANAQK